MLLLGVSGSEVSRPSTAAPIADSNRFATPGAVAQLTVVRTAAALGRYPALVGTISTGSFPPEIALEPGRPTILVGNFGSDQLEAVDLRHLP